MALEVPRDAPCVKVPHGALPVYAARGQQRAASVERQRAGVAVAQVALDTL